MKCEALNHSFEVISRVYSDARILISVSGLVYHSGKEKNMETQRSQKTQVSKIQKSSTTHTYTHTHTHTHHEMTSSFRDARSKPTYLKRLTP